MSVSDPLAPRSGERVRERGPRREGKLCPEDRHGSSHDQRKAWFGDDTHRWSDEKIVEAVATVMRRRRQHSARRGRAGTPAEVVLRMLALKHLRDWSSDELERGRRRRCSK